MEKIEAEVERHVRLSGGSRTGPTPWGPQDVSSEKRKDARHKSQLKKFYRAVIKKIEKYDRIYIYGPGEAKIELKREMARIGGLVEKIKKFETADKMTEKQFAALLRKQFEQKG
jgi:hypothetical protein